MKKNLQIASVVVCLSVSLGASAVTNGSFEDLDASYVNDSGWDLDDAAAGTGWSIFQTPDWIWSNGPEDLYNTPDGTYFALGAATGSFATSVYREGVYQSVSGFTIGEQYEISFSHANGLRYNAQTLSYEGVGVTGGWQVLLDGTTTSLGLIPSTNDNSTPSGFFTSEWQDSSVTFTATAETHEVRFVAYKPDSASQDPTFQFLDSVDVQLVPEPSTLIILSAVGALALQRRRRKRD